MLFAVYCPPQAPGPGHEFLTISRRLRCARSAIIYGQLSTTRPEFAALILLTLRSKSCLPGTLPQLRNCLRSAQSKSSARGTGRNLAVEKEIRQAHNDGMGPHINLVPRFPSERRNVVLEMTRLDRTAVYDECRATASTGHRAQRT